MILKLLVFVLCFLALLGAITAIGSMGPLGIIDVNSVYVCNEPEKPPGDEIKVTVDFININDAEEKAVNVIFENKIPIDDDLNVVVDIKKFELGNWYPFYTIKGKLCSDLSRSLKKLWSKFVTSFEPKIAPKLCPIPPGSYKLDKFQVTNDDIDIKSIFYGKLMVKVTLTDQSGKLIYCVVGEGESKSIM